MSKFVYIPFLLLALQCISWGAVAQVKMGNVSLHSDPRLSVLQHKMQATAHNPTAHNEARSKNADAGTSTHKSVKNNADTHATTAKVKNSKEPNKKHDAAEDKPKRYAGGESVGESYRGQVFRVQIYNGPDRNKAAQIKAQFMRNYPGVPTYLTYISPAYRVKVGDYRSRSDAMGMYKEACSSYTPCMIVPDKLNIVHD